MNNVPANIPGSKATGLTHDFCHLDSKNSDEVYRNFCFEEVTSWGSEGLPVEKSQISTGPAGAEKSETSPSSEEIRTRNWTCEQDQVETMDIGRDMDGDMNGLSSDHVGQSEPPQVDGLIDLDLASWCPEPKKKPIPLANMNRDSKMFGKSSSNGRWHP